MVESIDEYHKLYEKVRVWENNSWFGIPMWKLPMDAFVIQQLIVDLRPSWIIETGTGYGGSAMFYASICELLGEGNVVTIDIEEKVGELHKEISQYEWSDRITFLHGSSTNPLIVEQVWRTTGYDDLERFSYSNGAFVLLDSWHEKDHVLKEMDIYSKFVHSGGYMIVEDTHANGHPVPWKYGDGPYEAVEEWLKENKNWSPDYSCEKHLMTFNPMGFLRRI